MTLQITSNTYHLRYHVDEDRIFLSVDVSAEHELAMPLSRRLTRNLVAALAKLVAERGQAVTAGAPPALRDTILDFEHSQSVANAVAEGTMRNETREKTPAVPPKLVHEVKLVQKPGGALSLVFLNGEQSLTVEVAADRIHMVIETFLQMAERAGWDFPPIASWLDPAKTTVTTASGKTLN